MRKGLCRRKVQMYKFCCYRRSRCPRRRMERQMIKYKSQDDYLSSSVWWRQWWCGLYSEVSSNKLKFGEERKVLFLFSHSGAKACFHLQAGAQMNFSHVFLCICTFSVWSSLTQTVLWAVVADDFLLSKLSDPGHQWSSLTLFKTLQISGKQRI